MEMSRWIALGAGFALAAAMSNAPSTSSQADAGQPIAALDDWVSVAAANTTRGGATHTCGVRVGGSLWCWGVNGSGELGLGDTTNRYKPFRVGSEADWASVDVGKSNTCAVKSSGTLWCWGGSFDTAVPAQVGTATSWQSISLGGDGAIGQNDNYFRCGVQSDTSLWCWGDNSSGQLGLGDKVSRSEPTQVSTGWGSVSTGTDHACGVRVEGSLWCWGYNGSGRLGIGVSPPGVDVPTEVDAGSRWTTVTAGAAHSCGIHRDGSAWCWGSGGYGELGNGKEHTRYLPGRVQTKRHWSAITAGYLHTCAIRDDDRLLCWGSNYAGQVGIGRSPLEQLTPARVAAASWRAVATGGSDSCGVQSDHTLWCWGSPEGGELGVGNRTRHTAVPVRVGLPNAPVPVSYSLSGVDALAGDDVWAVGETQRKALVGTFVEHWDGATWQRVPAVDRGRYSSFDAVGAASADDVWAVGAFRDGTRDRPLLEHWNGSEWSRVPVADRISGRLTSVSVHARDDIWVVGYRYPETYYSIPLTLHYDGTDWTVIQTAANPTWSTQRFTDVDVLSPNDVWAVGYGRQDDEAGYLPLAEHWDGQKWRNVPVGFGEKYDNHYLRGVAVVSPRSVWALGDRTMTSDYDHEIPLARHWNGSRWKQAPVPDPGVKPGTYLRAADAAGVGDVWAVGQAHDGDTYDAFTVYYDGAKWTQVAAPNPSGDVDVQLAEVDARTSNDVWAVGYAQGAKKAEPLVEHWDGSAWTILQSRHPV